MAMHVCDHTPRVLLFSLYGHLGELHCHNEAAYLRAYMKEVCYKVVFYCHRWCKCVNNLICPFKFRDI